MPSHAETGEGLRQYRLLQRRFGPTLPTIGRNKGWAALGSFRDIEPSAAGKCFDDLATDRPVSLVVRTVPPLSIGRKIGPDSIPAASNHARNALAGQATSPLAMAMVVPARS
jgi:hypothetical protein